MDDKDNVWLAGNGPKDGMILKFTRDGKLLMKIGEPGVIGNDAGHRGTSTGPANVVVDPATRELFVADGYGNHRVIVFDAETGAYKRHWGANGRPPGDAGVEGLRQSRALHPALARRAACTSATARTTASRSSARTAPS